MSAPTLVVSHPPHGDVDHNLAAPVCFAWRRLTYRLTANYSVPEIWLAKAVTLNALLESLASGLSALEHEDLPSRLAFLTQAAG